MHKKPDVRSAGLQYKDLCKNYINPSSNME